MPNRGQDKQLDINMRKCTHFVSIATINQTDYTLRVFVLFCHMHPGSSLKAYIKWLKMKVEHNTESYGIGKQQQNTADPFP